MRASYLRNSLGLIVIQGLNLVVPVVLIPIVVSVQGLETYGQYATVLAYYMFGAMICDFGFDYSAVRELKRHPDLPLQRAQIIRDTFSAKFLLLLLVCPATALAISQVAKITDVFLIAAGALIPCVSAFSVHWLYLAEGRLARLVIPIGIARALSIGVVLLLYPSWPQVSLIVLLTTIPVLGVNGVLWTLEQKKLPVGAWVGIARGMRALQVGAPAFYVSFLGSFISASPVLAASVFIDSREIGVFAAIERITKAAFGVAKPFLVALYPEMSALYASSQADWMRIILRVLQIGCGIGITVAIVVGLWWEEIGGLLWGTTIPNSRWIAFGFIAWLTVGILNNAIGIQGLVASGRERQYGRNALIAASGLVIGFVTLGPVFAQRGILTALIAAELVLLFLCFGSLRFRVKRHAA